MSKGFNSILFDFDSLIDYELSVIQWMRQKFRDSVMENFDKHKLLYTPMERFRFSRIYGVEDVFESILTYSGFKDKPHSILHSIIEAFDEEIFTKDIAYPTDMQALIRAYKKAGDGVIKTTVRCDNDVQVSYVKSVLPDVSIEKSSIEDVDMSKYTRLVSGNVFNVLKYKLNEPKSILMLNFRENFTENDITLLKPELVISLGDIHDIQVISAFAEENESKPEG